PSNLLLSTVLCTLLRATLAVGHLPSSWREARVVFIPKQGKTSYTEAKSYRPISLTSFLLKTLEKIIDKHLRDSALGRLPLHENQYAYQSGKSCEQAIHELARRAEIAFRHKEIALATFLDIEGAFDRTSFLSMERALQRRGVEPTLTRDHLHTKQQNSSCCFHEPLQHRGDGACWWMICYPIFGGRAFTRRVTPMILPSWSAGQSRCLLLRL
ncbi:hypothetical protein Trydic_g19333, partial [Trypoxylus dichotomus]